MDQKERMEAFRRGQNAGEYKEHTEEEWKARRALRRKRQRRRKESFGELKTTAIGAVAVVAAAAGLFKILIWDQGQQNGDYVGCVSGEEVTEYFEGYASAQVPTEPVETESENSGSTDHGSNCRRGTFQRTGGCGPVRPRETGYCLHGADSIMDRTEIPGCQRLFPGGRKADRHQ